MPVIRIGRESKKVSFHPTLQVGDFWYLLLRIRTENSVVLNREYQDRYRLKVRGTLQHKNRKLYDVHCDVLVRILDKNDISPLFYPKTYNISVSEMTPLHQTVLKVSITMGYYWPVGSSKSIVRFPSKRTV